ncbi:MAG: 5-oxoprolinase subunit PxpB [Chloroflexota bacterium]|nr:5-oxoprolinase subunit PxpB [Chloroflexota bacterium]
MSAIGISFQPLAESALLFSLGDEIDPALVNRVMALAAAIDREAIDGVTDVVSSYTTIMVVFDPAVADYDALTDAFTRLADEPATSADAPSRQITIPVAYGGEMGPDLDDVARHTELSADEVIVRHAAATYVVASMGFAPGFGFLIGLPAELAIPRRRNPRTRVPAGSVAIGGIQTGVYSLETPGGWNVIGRTPLVLFDHTRDEPTLLQRGDHVRFQSISAAEYRAIAEATPNPRQPGTSPAEVVA